MDSKAKTKLLQELEAAGFVDKEARNAMLQTYAAESDENRPKQLERWKKADEAKKKEYVERFKKQWKDGEPKRAAGTSRPPLP